MTLDDLNGQTFASIQQAAAILGGSDERTVRRAAADGSIPSIQVGARRLIPTSWLRQQAGDTRPALPPVDLDQLADRVADRIAAKIFGAFAALAPDVSAAGPAPPGPAANVDDPAPAKERSRAQRTSAA
jgi:excisionase family DNA binding protein